MLHSYRSTLVNPCPHRALFGRRYVLGRLDPSYDRAMQLPVLIRIKIEMREALDYHCMLLMGGEL